MCNLARGGPFDPRPPFAAAFGSPSHRFRLVSTTTYQPPTAFGLMPPVVKNLLILNGLAFLAQFALGRFDPLYPLIGPVERWLALWPLGTPDTQTFGDVGTVAIPAFWPWQLVTGTFLHGGFGHLFFNMLGLWMFGAQIETALGSRRFAWFYLACVLGASALQLAVTSAPYLAGEGQPFPPYTLGASGGVLGVMAAFGLLYPNTPIYLYFVLAVPAKWVVLAYAAFDLYAGVTGRADGVANFAHLGGMIVGALLILYWRGRLPVRPAHRLAI